MQHRRSAGYSLSEILVVVAIIGILSLITVPAFMNFQRSGILKSGMRTVATDLRSARTNAIKRAEDIRVEFYPGASTSLNAKQYRAYSSQNGTTWTAITPRRAFTSAVDDGAGETFKVLNGPVWIDSATNFRTIGGNINIVFHPNGTADITGGGTQGQVALATKSDELFTNQYTISVSASGQIRSWTAQCNDRLDNDGDGNIDELGLDEDHDGTPEKAPDPGCADIEDNTEG